MLVEAAAVSSNGGYWGKVRESQKETTALSLLSRLHCRIPPTKAPVPPWLPLYRMELEIEKRLIWNRTALILIAVMLISEDL